MFGALLQGLTDFKPDRLDLLMKDIEELNMMAGNYQTAISKISFASYPFIADKYQILNAGSAIGYKNGPILVSRHKIYPDEVKDLHIAIPGLHTTANLLLEILFSGVKQKTSYLFSDIEDVVMDNGCDAGLIIHENRFTYQKKGLLKIVDLGEMWEKEYDIPVPLGGIVLKRNLPQKLKKDFADALADSIRLAFNDSGSIWPFIKENAKEMDDDVIQSHINLYVNEFSIDLGEKGKQAIRMLLEKGAERGMLPDLPDDIFFS
jgi:1,4-dihydroxy-6-naphthoate synthase